MNLNNHDPLASLRDIHLPEPVSIWPLAPGWYFVAGAIILLTMTLVWFIYQHWRANRFKRRALLELKNIEENYALTQNTIACVTAISELLKRFSLAYYPRNKVAALYGDDWVEFLIQHNPQTIQNKSLIQAIANTPYQKEAQLNAQAVLTFCRQWLSNF